MHIVESLVEGFGALDHLLRGGAHLGGNLIEDAAAFLQLAERFPPGDGFDAADARRRAALVGDHENADVVGLVHMGAAAQLVGEDFLLAHADIAHHFAVFFPKEGHRALVQGFLQGAVLHVQFVVIEDFVVDVTLDLLDLLVGQRFGVGEVEAQAVGGDQRPGLPGVGAEDVMQGGVQQVGGGVVAHDVLAPAGVHRGDDFIAHPRGAAQHLARVDDDPRGGFAHIGHADRPAVPADFAGIAHLPAGFDVETGLRQQDFDVVAGGGGFHGAAIHHQGQQFTLKGQVARFHIGVVSHTFGGQFPRGLQFIPQLTVNVHILAAQRAHRLARPGCQPVGFHRLAETLLVHVQAALLGDVAGDLEGHAERGVEVGGLRPGEHTLPAGFQFVQQAVEAGGSAVERALELLLLAGDGLQDGLAVFAEFGVKAAVVLDDGIRHGGQERLVQAEFAAEAVSAADDHAADVVAPQVTGHHAVGNQEGGGTPVVGDHAVGGEVGLALGVAVPGEFLRFADQRPKQVGAVVGAAALQDIDDAFQPHAGIHMGGGQRFEGFGVEAVVLDENQVPQFDEAVGVEGFHGDRAFFGAQINVDFGARPAGAGIRHFPEVILAPQVEEMPFPKPRLFPPISGGFLIRGDFALLVPEDGGVQVLPRQPPDLGEQFPGPGDGFLFVVIAKRPVAEHLEEGVVGVILPHVFEVVVLAGDAHTLLRVDGAGVGAFIRAQKNVLELHHPGVGEQQRGIPAGDERRRRHEGVPGFFDEEINELLADLVSSEGGRGHGELLGDW